MTLPREEEPQIKVPMIDIFVQAPGMSPKEVEERVTTPMEKLLWEIPGVEYIYSTSSEGMALAVVRYYVGTDEETAVIRTYSKLYMHLDKIPPGVSMPLVKPRGIDDVPILTLTFWGEGYDHYHLRRIAAEVEREVKTSDRYSQLRRDSPREEQRVAVPHGFGGRIRDFTHCVYARHSRERRGSNCHSCHFGVNAACLSTNRLYP